jgi:glycosyltransferase involved in cell wall biosynthesis
MDKKAVMISAVIITLNEEKNIMRCIESLQGVADEIVVVDSCSTDHTKEICLEMGVTFIEHAFEGYVEQKNYAVRQARYEYVLSLDADEVLSPQLKQSILSAKEDWSYDGYKFNRLTNYCGRWIRHCGWYPDTKLRLWDRRKGEWKGDKVYETLKMLPEAGIQHLKGDLLHYSYHNITHHIVQTNQYATFMAEEKFKKNKKVIPFFHVFLYPT